jgi:hypothetical protein
MNNLPITSLSLDVIILIACGLLVGGYVYKEGVKQLILLHLSLYTALVVRQYINITVTPLGPISGEGIIYLLSVGVIWFALHKSPLGQTLTISKSHKYNQYIYTCSLLTLILSIFFPFLQISNSGGWGWLESSLFTKQTLTLFWLLLPIAMLTLIKPVKKK